MPYKTAVYNGLSNSLSAAIDTGNAEEVAAVLDSIDCAYDLGQITEGQAGDLSADAREAGYDF